MNGELTSSIDIERREGDVVIGVALRVVGSDQDNEKGAVFENISL